MNGASSDSLFIRQTQNFQFATTKGYISPRQLSRDKLPLKSYIGHSNEKPKTVPIHQRLRSKFGVGGVTKDPVSYNETLHAGSPKQDHNTFFKSKILKDYKPLFCPFNQKTAPNNRNRSTSECRDTANLTFRLWIQ